jgi:hypothetical protein
MNRLPEVTPANVLLTSVHPEGGETAPVLDDAANITSVLPEVTAAPRVQLKLPDEAEPSVAFCCTSVGLPLDVVGVPVSIRN